MPDSRSKRTEALAVDRADLDIVLIQETQSRTVGTRDVIGCWPYFFLSPHLYIAGTF